MRLVVLMQDSLRAEVLRRLLYACGEEWDISLCSDAHSALLLLCQGECEVVLLQGGASVGGQQVLEQLASWHMPCPPRVLYLCGLEERGGVPADCIAPVTASVEQLCRLVIVLAQKPLPTLALQDEQRLFSHVERLLDELCMPKTLKGRTYAAWLLRAITPSPLMERMTMGVLYAHCAQAHKTTAAAVERCLRVAVEYVFTQGSIQAIERCFGTTVDPEKGKPTNRAFLARAAQLLRRSMADHSLAATRSPNSSEMHQRPAAPTSV